MLKNIRIAIDDLNQGVGKINLAFILGWQDIRQRYRRSKLGPFWLTISMGVMIGMIGIVFGQVLSTPMQEYLPFLATGLIFWAYFSTGIMDGCTSFIDAQGMIRQMGLPLSLYVLRVLWRNIVICGHNMIILPIVFLVTSKGFTWDLLWIIPGFLVFSWNMLWIFLCLGVLCTRFRDMPQIVSSLMQVFFYITPILWMPGAIAKRTATMLIEPNPVYHVMELVRAPVLGFAPTPLNWGISIGIAVMGSLFTLWFFGKYKKRIAYWL